MECLDRCESVQKPQHEFISLSICAIFSGMASNSSAPCIELRGNSNFIRLSGKTDGSRAPRKEQDSVRNVSRSGVTLSKIICCSMNFIQAMQISVTEPLAQVMPLHSEAPL